MIESKVGQILIIIYRTWNQQTELMTQESMTFFLDSNYHPPNPHISYDPQFPLQQYLNDRHPLSRTTQQMHFAQTPTSRKNKWYSSNKINDAEKKVSPNRSQVSKQCRRPSPVPSKLSYNEDRFREIEEILNRQNSNLKQHREFLTIEVRKCNQMLKKYKNKIKSYQQKILQLKQQNEVYQFQYMQIRNYVFEGINRMEHIVKDDLSFNFISPSSICQSQKSTERDVLAEISSQIEQIKHGIQLSEKNNNLKHTHMPQTHIFITKKTNTSNQAPQKNLSCFLNADSFTQKGPGSSSVGSKTPDSLTELNQKFESLMEEYRRTRNQEVRKKCMEIAKQIKQVKDRSHLNMQRHNKNPEDESREKFPVLAKVPNTEFVKKRSYQESKNSCLDELADINLTQPKYIPPPRTNRRYTEIINPTSTSRTTQQKYNRNGSQQKPQRKLLVSKFDSMENYQDSRLDSNY